MLLLLYKCIYVAMHYLNVELLAVEIKNSDIEVGRMPTGMAFSI